MRTPPVPILPTLYVLLSAFGFATLGIFGQLAHQQGMGSQQALFFRFLFALPFQWLWILLVPTAPLNFKQIGAAILLGFFGIGIEATLYFESLRNFGPSITAVFLYLYPFFVLLIEMILDQKRIPLKKAALFFVAFIGVILLTQGGSSEQEAKGFSWIPACIGILTGLWFALFLRTSDRLLQGASPLKVTGLIQFGAMLFFSRAIFEDDFLGLEVFQDPKRLGTVLGLALFSTVVPFGFLMLGMKKLRASSASLISTSEVAWTAILAYFIFNEQLLGIQLLGVLFTLLSVVGLQWTKNE